MPLNELVVDASWTEEDDAQAVVITERGKPLVAPANSPRTSSSAGS